MSHMVKGKTELSVENAEILVEALQAAYEGCTIERNTQANIRGRPMCDIVVRRNGRNDIGFRLNADKNYDCLAYEPGYMSSQKSINKALQAVYEPYIRGTTKKMMKNSPVLSSYVMGKTKEVDRNGKKMKRIRLTPSGGGGWV